MRRSQAFQYVVEIDKKFNELYHNITKTLHLLKKKPPQCAHATGCFRRAFGAQQSKKQGKWHPVFVSPSACLLKTNTPPRKTRRGVCLEKTRGWRCTEARLFFCSVASQKSSRSLRSHGRIGVVCVNKYHVFVILWYNSPDFYQFSITPWKACDLCIGSLMQVRLTRPDVLWGR